MSTFIKGLFAGLLAGSLATFMILTQQHKRDIQRLQAELQTNARECVKDINDVRDYCVAAIKKIQVTQ